MPSFSKLLISTYKLNFRNIIFFYTYDWQILQETLFVLVNGKFYFLVAFITVDRIFLNKTKGIICHKKHKMD